MNSTTKKNTGIEDFFASIKIEELNPKIFSRYVPATYEELVLKEQILKALKDVTSSEFFYQKSDLKFNSNNTGICFNSENEMPFGLSYNQWDKMAKAFCPERKSRLATKTEYIIILSYFIDKLVSSKISPEVAWHVVLNAPESLHTSFGKGVSRTAKEVSTKLKAFSSTRKILDEDVYAGGYWKTGGGGTTSKPLAKLSHLSFRDDENYDAIGLIVLEPMTEKRTVWTLK